MRIATSIDWTMIQQFFTGFFTSKKICIISLMTLFATYFTYDNIEWSHHSQMPGVQDDFLTHWGWIVTIPAAIWWLWAETTKKHFQQIAAGLLFLFLGPVLAMGVELRNLHIFSIVERWEMLVCIFVGVASFFAYIRAKIM